MENRIKVIDSYPGSGKTSYAIQNINQYDEDVKVIYITPYLKEVDRIIASCPNRNFIQPETRKGKGSKMTHLISLVTQGKNIVSTHALFTNITEELIDALKLHNYVLYLDEVFQTVEKYSIFSDTGEEDADAVTKQDVESLLAKGYIQVEDDFSISWIDNEHMLSKYEPIKNLADRGLLYFVSGSLLLWSFPVEVFMEGIFSEIFILTYNFTCQLQSYYYSYFNVQYTEYHVFQNGKYVIRKTENRKHEKEWKDKIREKITIVEDERLNRIGDPHRDIHGRLIDTALSANWHHRNQDALPILSNNLANFFKNVTRSKADERLWTCFKEYRKKIKSKNVSEKYWLAINARATNDYSERTTLAYLINCYVDPFYEKFFQKRDIQINQDLYAVTELVQWIWRSAIRNGNPINLYIPSHRMRVLLQDFLAGKT